MFCVDSEISRSYECPTIIDVCDSQAIKDEIQQLKKFSKSLDAQLFHLEASPLKDDGALLGKCDEEVRLILTQRLMDLMVTKRKGSKTFTYLEKSAAKYKRNCEAVERRSMDMEKLIEEVLVRFTKIEKNMNKTVEKLFQENQAEWNRLMKIKRMWQKVDGEVKKLKPIIADLQDKISDCQEEIEFTEKVTCKTQQKLVQKFKVKKDLNLLEKECEITSECFDDELKNFQNLSNEITAIVDQVADEKEKLQKALNEINEDETIVNEILSPWKNDLSVALLRQMTENREKI